MRERLADPARSLSKEVLSGVEDKSCVDSSGAQIYLRLWKSTHRRTLAHILLLFNAIKKKGCRRRQDGIGT